jgi:hypothetical protein
MRWATRGGPHVDRTACGWLIRCFIDSKAEFVLYEYLRRSAVQGRDPS